MSHILASLLTFAALLSTAHAQTVSGAQEHKKRLMAQKFDVEMRSIDSLEMQGLPSPVESSLYQFYDARASDAEMYSVGQNLYCVNVMPRYRRPDIKNFERLTCIDKESKEVLFEGAFRDDSLLTIKDQVKPKANFYPEVR